MAHDHLRNSETESHAALIKGFRGSDFSKELEKLLLVLRFNADACVCDLCYQSSVIIRNIDCYATLECEFDSIAKQVEQHLLVSFLIGPYDLRYLPIHLCYQLKVLLLDLEVHNWANLLNCSSNIKGSINELELIVLYPAHVKGIFDQVL